MSTRGLHIIRNRRTCSHGVDGVPAIGNAPRSPYLEKSDGGALPSGPTLRYRISATPTTTVASSGAERDSP